MRKITTRILLTSITFAVGVATIVLGVWLFQVESIPVIDDPVTAQTASTSPHETKAVDVSVCVLKNDPAKYNHIMVKLTGYFSRGFEDSSLYDPSCKSKQFIWVDLGGKRSINVMYCCGFTPRPFRDKELKVEGVKLPLVEDKPFDEYNNALAKGKNVKATVIGTFFAGEKVKYPGGTFYSGYGHMGIGSLFIVQQVLASETISSRTKSDN